MFNFTAAPTRAGDVAWVAYAVPVLVLFLLPARRGRPTPPPTRRPAPTAQARQPRAPTADAAARLTPHPRRHARCVPPVSCALAAAGVLAAPASPPAAEDDTAGRRPPADTIAVTATDTACEVGQHRARRRPATFTVTNTGSKVTEFYVYAAGDRVMGEVENIAPGLSRELHVELPAGHVRDRLQAGHESATASGGASRSRGDRRAADRRTPKLADGGRQLPALRAEPDRRAGRPRPRSSSPRSRPATSAKAKALYPVARTYWERIEPVAEIFGDLDPKIDGREDVHRAEGMEFTGFHRIEKDLWATGDISKDGPIADQLLADVAEDRGAGQGREARPRCSSPTAPRNCSTRSPPARSPARRTATRTPTCGTSPPTSRAPRPPSTRCAPCSSERDPDLVDRARRASSPTSRRRSAQHRAGDGWKLHTELTKAQLKELADAINALAEPVSKVAAAVASDAVSGTAPSSRRSA